MKLPSRLLLSVLLIGIVRADPPRSVSPSRYKDLYLNSAFTDPLPEVEPEDIPNDLPDWVLVGLSKYVDGVTVKLMNKKDRSRVTIPSPEATKMGFSIKEVKQDRNFIDEAVVTVRKGSVVGDVYFDPQFLVLKQSAGAPAGGNAAAAQAAAARAAAGRSNGGNNAAPPIPVPTPANNQPNNGNANAKRPPIPGQVPTPTPANANTSTQSKNSSGSSSSRRRRFVRPTK